MAKPRYALTILVFLCVLAPLRAGTLSGADFSASITFDNIPFGSPTTGTVPQTAFLIFFNLAINDTTVVARDFAFTKAPTTPDPAGWILTFIGAPPITGVALDPASNVPAGDLIITSTPDSISIDWHAATLFGFDQLAGPDPQPVSFIQLDISSTPEPVSIGLCCLGLIGMAALIRRQRRNALH